MAMNYHGRARVSASAPEAMGVCDACQFLYSLNDLRFQREWAGTEIVTLGKRVCPRCYDVPTNNKRAIYVAPDPMPVQNPRPANYSVADVPSDGYTDSVVDALFPLFLALTADTDLFSGDSTSLTADQTQYQVVRP